MMTVKLQGWAKRVRKALAIGTFLILAAIGSQSAWALTCQTYTNETQFVEPIGRLSVPDSVPDGSIIWISPTRTTSGTCKKAQNDWTLGIADPISFYSVMGKSQALYPGDPNSWGISISIKFNGTEYPLEWMFSGVPTEFVLPPCSPTDYEAGRCFINVSITYQIIIRKHGLSPFLKPTQDMFSLFQFDGVRGINCCQPSFQYVLSGLSNIVGTSCKVDVKVTPEPGVIDFGPIQSTGSGFMPAVPTQPFSLALEKQCATPIKIGGYLQTSHPIMNGLILPTRDSNFGIRINDANGRQVALQEPFPLVNFSASQSNASVEMSASLVSLGVPKVGPFTATATILVLYD
ncbi:fimbrial protein [Variovorax dokdonensis]|uniref:Fimbrial protein n=1 Tax=Variovorax dokdonensis TaxID=344883 RepID=A0ABT7NET9_9BURK|nr:fimbrial protein [Variovorax dokdonensis]MDM0046452.1 fimbrial protein [Variovorax dokdonensis]